MNISAVMQPEFSRVFDLEELDESPRQIDLTADEEECTLLSRRFDQKSIGRL